MSPDDDDVRRLALVWAAIARIEALRRTRPHSTHPAALKEQAAILDAIVASMEEAGEPVPAKRRWK